MSDIPFEGFSYDQGHAEAMADAIRATFDQARRFQVTIPDQLAALGIVAAELIRSTTRPAPVETFAQRLAAYVVAVAATLPLSPQKRPR